MGKWDAIKNAIL